MKNKKLFAILTLVCFMFTLMPVAAFAAVDEQDSYVLTVKDNPTIKDGERASILFDFAGDTTTTLYVWFLKDGANVPANSVKVVKSATAAEAVTKNAADVTPKAATPATANIFKIDATELEEYEFVFTAPGEYKVRASLDMPNDTTASKAIAGVGLPLQTEAAQNVITVKEANAATVQYKMVDVNRVLTHENTTPGNVVYVYADGAEGTLSGITANTATVKTVKLELQDKDSNPVKYTDVKIEAGSANVVVSKEKAQTNGLGQFSFDVSAVRDGEYKVYVSVGQYEMVIVVNAGTTQATTIELETAPKAPTALDKDYTANGLTGKVGFRIYDAAGGEVKAGGQGITGITNSYDEAYENFVALTAKPAASSLESKNFKLGWISDEYGWTILMDETFDEEGTYEFRVVLDNGASKTVSIDVKEMGTPVMIVFTYNTDAVELGSTITPKDISWVDANGVSKSINGTVDIAVSGYAVADVQRNATTTFPEITVKDDEKYVGSEIIVTAVDERYNLVATHTLTVANEATELAFSTKTAEVNVNNKIVVQVVDKDGNSVTPVGVTAGEASVVVLAKPEGAKVSATTSGLNLNKGQFNINLTSDKVGNVTVQAILKCNAAPTTGSQTNVVKYYTGTQVFAVGTDSTGDVVVFSVDSNQVIVNDEVKTIDVAPFIQNGRTFVPFRALAEAFGAEVAYDEATQAVTAELNGVTVVMTVGSATYTVNGEEATMDVAPFIQDGRTMVPVRFAAEAFGMADPIVTTNPADGTVADILFVM